MTIVKSPRVSMMNGIEMSFRTGRSTIFKRPKTTPAMAYSLIPPVKLNPGTNQTAAYIARALPKILSRKLNIFTVIIVACCLLKFNQMFGLDLTDGQVFGSLYQDESFLEVIQ